MGSISVSGPKALCNRYYLQIQEKVPTNPSLDFLKIQIEERLLKIEMDFSSATLHGAVKYH